MGGAAVAGMFGFARDQFQAAFRQIERRNQQRFVFRMLGIGGQEIKYVVHRSRNFRIGGQQTQVGINPCRACVVVAGPQVRVAARHAVMIAPHQQR